MIAFVFIVALVAVFVYLAVRWPGLAMLMSVVVSTALAIAFLALDNIVAGVCSYLIFLATLIAVVLSRQGPDRSTLAQNFALWFLLAIGFIGGVAGVAIIPGYGPIFFAILLAGTVVYYLLISRRAKAIHVVSTLSACMRQNLPLSQSLEAAAMGRTDGWARPLRHLSWSLAQGLPLSHALGMAYWACPGHVVATIRVAESIDQVPQALQRVEADLIERFHRRSGPQPVRLWYPILTLFAIASFLAGVGVFVIPSFQSIFSDMGIELPGATRCLIGFMNSGGLLLLALAVIFGLILVALTLHTKFRARRPEKPRLLSILGDFIKWHFPGLRWFERNTSLLHTVEALRMALSAGYTVDQAISTTLSIDVNGRFRGRLIRWLDCVQRGENISTAARTCGLGRSLAWAFDQNANPGNTPTALATLESFLRSNYNYAVRLAHISLWPCVVLATAVMVGFVVYAMIAPLAAINQACAANVFP